MIKGGRCTWIESQNLRYASHTLQVWCVYRLPAFTTELAHPHLEKSWKMQFPSEMLPLSGDEFLQFLWQGFIYHPSFSVHGIDSEV